MIFPKIQQNRKCLAQFQRIRLAKNIKTKINGNFGKNLEPSNTRIFHVQVQPCMTVSNTRRQMKKKINFDFSLPQFIKRVPFIDSSWICAGESENYFSMDSKMKLRTFQCLQNKQYFDIFYVS